MKKLFVSAGVISAMFLASCGGGSEICDCADMSKAMMEEMAADGADFAAITEKYKAEAEKCEKLGEGKTDEEMKAMEEEMKGCDSFKEMEKMMGGH